MRLEEQSENNVVLEIKELKENLITKVNEYLTKENPDPETASNFTKFVNFFARHGEEGRQRAKNYLSMLDGMENGDRLLLNVYSDIIQRTETLGTSRSLRKFLCRGIYISIQNKEKNIAEKDVNLKALNEALFSYLKLDKQERKRVSLTEQRKQILFSSEAGLGLVDAAEYDNIKHDVTTRMITNKLFEIVRNNEQQLKSILM